MAPRTKSGRSSTSASAERRRAAEPFSRRKRRRGRRSDPGVTTTHRVARDGPAVRVLLTDAIDYAGLFPPAQLDMPGAVAEYAAYLDSPHRWALGRFVVPAARLADLADAAT